MNIAGITHKALRRFAETGNAKGVIEPQRIARMLMFIASAELFEELAAPPNFGLHSLAGERAGVWAMTVTKNWRLTFRKVDEVTIDDLGLEDYH